MLNSIKPLLFLTLLLCCVDNSTEVPHRSLRQLCCFAGNSTYLTAAMAYKARSLEEETDAARTYNVFNYQNSLPGVNLLLAQATDFAVNEYTLATKGFMVVWMSGKYTIR